MLHEKDFEKNGKIYRITMFSKINFVSLLLLKKKKKNFNTLNFYLTLIVAITRGDVIFKLF